MVLTKGMYGCLDACDLDINRDGQAEVLSYAQGERIGRSTKNTMEGGGGYFFHLLAAHGGPLGSHQGGHA